MDGEGAGSVVGGEEGEGRGGGVGNWRWGGVRIRNSTAGDRRVCVVVWGGLRSERSGLGVSSGSTRFPALKSVRVLTSFASKLGGH